jgi:hypothetical protein
MQESPPTQPRTPRREVHQADGLAWLEEHVFADDEAVVTSLPDVSGARGMGYEEWRVWFTGVSRVICSRVAERAPAVFLQTDIKRDGRWVDKAYLIQKGAEEAGSHSLWHKVVCRTDPGNVSFGRPAYSHLLCFSRSLRLDPGGSTADVLPGTGRMTWPRAMGVDVCAAVCRFLLAETECRTVIDPFCGHGTMLAAANAAGMDAIGVELSPKRARKARVLRL